MTNPEPENQAETLPAKGSKNKGGRHRRRDWEDAHEALVDAYVEFMTAKDNPMRRQPTIKWLAERTGLGTKTVERHLDDLDRDINMSRRLKKFRLATDIVLKSMLVSATKGNVNAQKAFLEAVEQINLGSVVKVAPPDAPAGPDLSLLDDDELEAYQRLQAKLAGKGGHGTPEPSR